MLDWLKNITKEHPEFWKEYLSKFDQKSNRYVILSTEKTGLNPDKDVILSFGCFGVVNDSLLIGDNFEVVLLQYKFLHDNELSNEFIVESKLQKLGEPEAIQSLLQYIGNATLVGYRIDTDVEIINTALEKMDCGRLKNEPLDLEIMHCRLNDINNKQFTLDELCTLYKVPISDRNSASEEAYKMGLLFLKLKSRLGLK
ncbi:exonuclease domain-containing protein [Flavobacterium ammonificans]|jgi:DNA polymerase-3 subunit epsilon|uniref:exonuclease domain-containing protein n=1 Tax=Flavobacterium ammonificans TaxID=1751056 RepID=UPI001E40A8A8|nr:exonuclease domain-containing protein [Flavobacterium ammonificans]BDB57420.1 DNA polymerase III subunit epsilon [Flavobacterium ammonificans]